MYFGFNGTLYLEKTYKGKSYINAKICIVVCCSEQLYKGVINCKTFVSVFYVAC